MDDTDFPAGCSGIHTYIDACIHTYVRIDVAANCIQTVQFLASLQALNRPCGLAAASLFGAPSRFSSTQPPFQALNSTALLHFGPQPPIQAFNSIGLSCTYTKLTAHSCGSVNRGL